MTSPPTTSPLAPGVSLTIPRRFTGPFPGWANGGSVVGALAAHLAHPAVEVRIGQPVPVEVELTVTLGDDGVALHGPGGRLAVARPGTPPAEADLPPAVDLDAARRTRPAVPADGHPAAGCFVCGPSREAGLDLQPGPVDGAGVLATAWAPDPDLTDAPDGVLPHEVVHAALDCPGWYAGLGGEPALLGTMTAQQLRPVRVGEVVVVTARALGRDGRKVRVSTALRAPDGELLAAATAMWIVPRSPEPEGPQR
jgi:hypothetical protein